MHCATLLAHSCPFTVPQYLHTADRALCRNTCAQLQFTVPKYLHTSDRALCRSTCAQLPVHCAAVLAQSCHTALHCVMCVGVLCSVRHNIYKLYVCVCRLHKIRLRPPRKHQNLRSGAQRLLFKRPETKAYHWRFQGTECDRCFFRRPCALPSVTMVVRTVCSKRRSAVKLNTPKYSGNYMYHQFTFKQFYVLPTQCFCVFCVDLRTNSDCFPIQH